MKATYTDFRFLIIFSVCGYRVNLIFPVRGYRMNQKKKSEVRSSHTSL